MSNPCSCTPQEIPSPLSNAIDSWIWVPNAAVGNCPPHPGITKNIAQLMLFMFPAMCESSIRADTDTGLIIETRDGRVGFVADEGHIVPYVFFGWCPENNPILPVDGNEGKADRAMMWHGRMPLGLWLRAE